MNASDFIHKRKDDKRQKKQNKKHKTETHTLTKPSQKEKTTPPQTRLNLS